MQSFPPLCGKNPHTLIVGSMPGQKSLQQQEYYAHPRNSFWQIMAQIAAFDPTADYLTRCQSLTAAGFAVWDTLAYCQRQGSLDGAIKKGSEVPNDITHFLLDHPTIFRIACNGGKAQAVFRRFQEKQLPRQIQIIQLPSTSPAHARLTLTEKLAIWQEKLC